MKTDAKGKAKLDENFIDWFASSRLEAYEKLEKGEYLAFLDSHLPVMVTMDEGSDFPFNCANKGMALLPKEEFLGHYIELFESCISRANREGWKESFSRRLSAIKEFYSSTETIDRTRMGTLEIFEGRTLRNVRAEPRVAIHFTGSRPKYVSYQVNARAEIVKDNSSYFQFILLARKLFEHDSFHIFQPGYRFAYVFQVAGCIDKTPFSRGKK